MLEPRFYSCFVFGIVSRTLLNERTGICKFRASNETGEFRRDRRSTDLAIAGKYIGLLLQSQPRNLEYAGKFRLSSPKFMQINKPRLCVIDTEISLYNGISIFKLSNDCISCADNFAFLSFTVNFTR